MATDLDNATTPTPTPTPSPALEPTNKPEVEVDAAPPLAEASTTATTKKPQPQMVTIEMPRTMVRKMIVAMDEQADKSAFDMVKILKRARRAQEQQQQAEEAGEDGDDEDSQPSKKKQKKPKKGPAFQQREDGSLYIRYGDDHWLQVTDTFPELCEIQCRNKDNQVIGTRWRAVGPTPLQTSKGGAVQISTFISAKAVELIKAFREP